MYLHWLISNNIFFIY